MALPFLSPTGDKVWIDDDKARAALDAGYKYDPGEASDSPIRASLEGAARTATMGLSDKIATDIYDVPPAEMKARRELNPAASFIGEVGGGFAPGVGSTSRVIGGLKGALVEGGLMGLGSAISESALGNTQLTAEQAAAGMAGGVLGGGLVYGGVKALGAGLGKIYEAASPVVSSVGAKALGKLSSLSDDIERGALLDGAGKKLLKRAKAELPHGLAIDDAIKFGKEAGAISPGSAFDQDALALLQGRIDEVNGKLGQYLQRMDESIPLKVERKVQSALEGTVAGPNRAKPGFDVQSKIVAEMRSALDKFRKNSAYDSAVARAEEEIARFEAKKSLTWSDIWNTQSSLRESVDKMASDNLHEAVGAIRVAMRDAVVDASEKLAPGSRDAFKSLIKDRAAGQLAFDLFANRVQKSHGLSFKDLLYGGVLGGGNPLSALAVAAGKHQLDKRGAFLAAGAIRKLEQSGMLPAIAEQLHARTAQILATAPEMLGPFRMQIERSFSEGAQSLLATHTALAQSVRGDEYLGRMAMERETPEEEAGLSQKLAILAAAKEADAERAAELERTIDGVFRAQPGRPKLASASVTRENFDSRMQILMQIVQDPESALASIPPELAGAMPSVAMQAGAQIVNAAKYLHETAPKNPRAGYPDALQQPWRPSDAEISRWNRTVSAVEDPLSVVRAIAQGTVMQEQIKALQVVYPAMYADIKEKLVERIMGAKEPLPYNKRASLALILGPQVVGISPQQFQLLQQVHATTAAQGRGGAGGGSTDGRQKVDQNKNAQTQSQRLESR